MGSDLERRLSDLGISVDCRFDPSSGHKITISAFVRPLLDYAIDVLRHSTGAVPTKSARVARSNTAPCIERARNLNSSRPFSRDELAEPAHLTRTTAPLTQRQSRLRPRRKSQLENVRPRVVAGYIQRQARPRYVGPNAVLLQIMPIRRRLSFQGIFRRQKRYLLNETISER